MPVYIFGIFFAIVTALFCFAFAHQRRLHQKSSLPFYGLAILLVISAFSLLVTVEPPRPTNHQSAQFVESIPPIHTRFTVGG